MRGLLKAGLLALLGCAISLGAAIRGVRVENPTGNITAILAAQARVTYRVIPAARERDACVAGVDQPSGFFLVRCKSDGPPVELQVEVPAGVPFAAVSRNGSLAFAGVSRDVHLTTGTGDIRVTAPWSLMRVLIESDNKPKVLSLPKVFDFRTGMHDGQWVLSDRRPPLYGVVWVRTASPERIELADMPIPESLWVKPPSMARPVLDGWRKLSQPSKPAISYASDSPTGSQTTGDGLPLFTSDVRMVNLSVAVQDSKGRPVTGLRRGEFEVLESGVKQDLASMGAEEAPFNLALLLDLSGSTRGEREPMKEAARRFVGIARPRDRVAIYALANGLFYVVSPLTSSRQSLLSEIEAIPAVEGDTPLYEAIVLSCAQELLQHSDETNALIVITDGVDNQLSPSWSSSGSEVSFRSLRAAVASLPVLIYPVIVGPSESARFSREAARNMTALARASGGRIFEAKSVSELEPVYPQVAEELRSVYTLAYYPKNQKFDGKWRQLLVRVLHAGCNVRTRPGYYAW